ncbi:MAG: hypothetical protein Q8R75_11705 [Methyloversatilis sp.]|nr:hypothetical protein [Methyloversatilis sp.]
MIQLLADPDNKVLALSGTWGTGKSHLWRDIKAGSNNEAVKSALYVSLFGLRDMSQVKLKVLQSALPSAEKHLATWERVRVGMEGARKVLTSLHKGFSALDELALLAVPSLLKDKVIVLDDIERKHDKLSIDEVLGFIDEFTQQHGARFVLILNSDQLEDRRVWDTLREKVVDQEIRLNTSTAEAFGIAIGLVPSPYGESIRAAAERCGLTNIRNIRKVIKAVNRILGNRTDLSEALLSRVVPSTVLLAAIHYKGIEDGPDSAFVLSQGTPNDWSVFFDTDKAEDEESKRKAKWALLLNELGINGCDDFELLVIEFMQSGLFDSTAVTAIVDRYAAENDAMAARYDFSKFTERLIWDHRLTESDLLDEAKALSTRVHLIDVYNFTSFHDAVEELPDGDGIAKDMLDRWIAAFKAKDYDEFDDENTFGRKVHPAIKVEFDAIRANTQAKLTLFDACEFIAKNSGWSMRHEMVMKSATVEDFEATIKTIDIRRLRLFMRRMLEMTMQPGGYREHFGDATDRFSEACKNIAQDSTSGRLGKLIKRVFSDSKLSHLVEPSEQEGT